MIKGDDDDDSLMKDVDSDLVRKKFDAKEVMALGGLMKIEKLRFYFSQLLGLAMKADLSDVDRDLWQNREVLILLNRFISDETCPVLYLIQTQDTEKEESDAGFTTEYYCKSKLELTYITTAVAVVFKKHGVLEHRQPPELQLQWILLPINTEGIYEALQQILHLGFSPLLDSKLSNCNSNMAVDSTLKKLLDLEMSLHNLQQETLMPVIHFDLHPVVERMLENNADRLDAVTCADFGDLAHQSEFLNELQQRVNDYIRQVQKITQLDCDMSTSTTLQEVKFWQQMEAKLIQVESSLQEPGMKLTMDLLKNAKRFHATVSFLADTGLMEAKAKSHQYNQLMREFPIDRLLGATRLDQLADSVLAIFQHMLKKLKICSYPISRALLLAEAVGNDLYSKMRELLGPRRFLFSDNLSREDFNELCGSLEALLLLWDEQAKEFCKLARDLTRKRREKFIPVRIRSRHTDTQERLAFLMAFRLAHEHLQSSVEALDKSSLDKSAVLSQLDRAFDHVRHVDLFGADDSPSSAAAEWQKCEQAYQTELRSVEKVLAQFLQVELSKCIRSVQMYKVFQRYQSIIERSYVRTEVQEQQRQLVVLVKQDLDRLKKEWTSVLSHSQLQAVSRARDLPHLSMQIMKMQQFERQLHEYLNRLKCVLGSEWEHHADGQVLSNDMNRLLSKLDCQTLLQEYLEEIQNTPPVVGGPVFQLNDRSDISVRFDERLLDLYKNVQFLLPLNIAHIPHSVSSLAKDAYQAYPIYQTLKHAVMQWSTIRGRCTAFVYVSRWLARRLEVAQTRYFLEISALDWQAIIHMNSEASDNIFLEFVGYIDDLYRTSERAEYFANQIEQTLSLLVGCTASPEFADRVSGLQAIIDDLLLEDFCNIATTVRSLNDIVFDQLCINVEAEMALFVSQFNDTSHSSALANKPDSLYQSVELAVQADGHLVCQPSLNQVKASYYTILCSHIAKWIDIPTLHFDSSFTTNERKQKALASKLTVKAFKTIEDHVSSLKLYVSSWKRFLCLWQVGDFASQLGSNLENWNRFFEEWRLAKRSLNGTETEYAIGHTVCKLGKLQARINERFASVQRDLIIQYSSVLSHEQEPFYHSLKKYRSYLEDNLTSLGQIGQLESGFAEYVDCLQSLYKEMPHFAVRIHELKAGHKWLLQFSANSIDLTYEQIEGEYNALKTIFELKWDYFGKQKATYVEKATDLVAAFNDEMGSLALLWHNQKPVSSGTNPKMARDKLLAWREKFETASVQIGILGNLLQTLQISSSALPDVLVQSLKDEWSDLEVVWRQLDELNTSLERIENCTLGDADVAELRKNLLGWRSRSQDSSLAPMISSYEAFSAIYARYDNLYKALPLLEELCASYFTHRHWSRLLKDLAALGQNSLEIGKISSWTLKQIMSLEPLRYMSTFKAVISVAQGERGLAVFLEQVQEAWDALGFTWKPILAVSGAECVTNFDVIESLCSEQIAILQQMHHSPYFAQFETQVVTWEGQIEKAAAVTQLWSETQFKCWHLEQIFSNVRELTVLLPLESAKFEYSRNEYVQWTSQMRNSRASVLQVVIMSGTQSLLERTFDALEQFQAALGKFLETQRRQFPRFYFLGDEDILQMIANRESPSQWSEQLGKIFAGVKCILHSKDSNSLIGFGSAAFGEGESVHFAVPIALDQFNSVVDVLAAVEQQIKVTLKGLLVDSLCCLLSLPLFTECRSFFDKFTHLTPQCTEFQQWVYLFPAQICSLTLQLGLTAVYECNKFSIEQIRNIAAQLTLLISSAKAAVRHSNSETNAGPASKILLKKLDQLLMISLRFQASLEHYGADTADYNWQKLQRFYVEGTADNIKVVVKMAEASVDYGFEYLGVVERLVHTPLTEKCYMTLMMALAHQLGGSPFGPAGTGKTETVKALGCDLGKQVLVFNCDERFDFQSMGRIFTGICQVGAWGCFDEFNRLHEEMLSAVSSQIQTIQLAQKQNSSCMLLGQRLQVQAGTALFITMNPGYAGRSHLPDNIKSLFLQVAMSRPDAVLIAESLLYVHGFTESSSIAAKLVPFFRQCAVSLSPQKHYDFGLRALKALIGVASSLVRKQDTSEVGIIVQSLTLNLAPQLVSSDVEVFYKLIKQNFSVDVDSLVSDTISALPSEFDAWVRKACDGLCAIYSEQLALKVAQMYHMQYTRTGIMLVGKSGSGKTTVLEVLIRTISGCLFGALDKVPVYRIDPKSLEKDDLFGKLDKVSRDWTDGWFTALVRKHDTAREPVFIVLDGEIDPEWVENLNSVLDDNRLLTLPNGERISLSENLHIIFEVNSLVSVTTATVSRCGMVYYDEGIVSSEMRVSSALRFGLPFALNTVDSLSEKDRQDILSVCTHMLQSSITSVKRLFSGEFSLGQNSLSFSQCTVLSNLFSSFTHFVVRWCGSSRWRNSLENVLERGYMYCMYWSFSSFLCLDDRQCVFEKLLDSFGKHVYEGYVDIETGEWSSWSQKVPETVLSANSISSGNSIVPTTDTVCHEHLLKEWLRARRPVILCGPPGSGKTMSLCHAVKQLYPDAVLVMVQCSSNTTVQTVLQALDPYGEYVTKNKSGELKVQFATKQHVVLFLDEINLPQNDKYGNTARVLTWLRQWLETGSFYSPKHGRMVQCTGIDIVGACNPPTDPGRVQLPLKLLKLVSVLYVDYPSDAALYRIYASMLRAVFSEYVSLDLSCEPYVMQMISFFGSWRRTFPRNGEIPAHYTCSPRELTRWVRDIAFSLSEYVKGTGEPRASSFKVVHEIFYYSGFRLFNDRVVINRVYSTINGRQTDSDTVNQLWASTMQNSTVDFEPNEDSSYVYSRFIDGFYSKVSVESLTLFLKARSEMFYDETNTELPFNIVWHRQAVQALVRIERALFQPQGHLLLLGTPCSGRSLIVSFACWLAGHRFHPLPLGEKWYGMADFESDLRDLLKRASCNDESTVIFVANIEQVPTAFVERLNALLATGQVPDLYDSSELLEIYSCFDGHSNPEAAFTERIIKNVHVVFTKNEKGSEGSNLFEISPALVNRCVINYVEPLQRDTLQVIADEILHSIRDLFDSLQTFEDTKVAASKVYLLLHTHQGLAVSPMQYIEFLLLLKDCFADSVSSRQKRMDVLARGITKLEATRENVDALKLQLDQKSQVLAQANKEANKSLTQFIADQQEAESKQATALTLQNKIAYDSSLVAERKEQVTRELDSVAPLVESAKAAVRDIKKAHLTELRSMTNPPEAVKLTLEAVCVLLDYTSDVSLSNSWKNAQAAMRRDDFISSILHYDTKRNLTDSIRNVITQRYLTQPLFVYDAVQRASKACGPLLKWVLSQVEYASILHKVAPLQEEMDKLEAQARETTKQASHIESVLKELQQRIVALKQIHAEQMVQVQAIEQELSGVKSKYDRAALLLRDLAQEEQRWKQVEMILTQEHCASLVAESFIKSLTSTFLTALSNYDSLLEQIRAQVERQLGCDNSMESDDAVKTDFSPSIAESVQSYLQMPFARFPLVVDPEGQAATQIIEHLQGQKKHIVQGTMLEPQALAKQLEATLRFGHTLIIQDAEFVDAGFMNILCRKRRFERVGGRIILHLGRAKIDVSPHFGVVFVTKTLNAQYILPPALSARVTAVHCGITKETLANRALHELLLLEAPQVEESRVRMVADKRKLDAMLVQSETQLLDKLSSSTTVNILDDSELYNALVQIKEQAASAELQLQELGRLWDESKAISSMFEPVSQLAVLEYGLVERLNCLNELYNFSLSYFIDIFRAAVTQSRCNDDKPRAEAIEETFVQLLYRCIGRGLFEQHKTAFAYALLSLRKVRSFESVLSALEHFQSVQERESMLDALQGIELSGFGRYAESIRDTSSIDFLQNLVTSETSSSTPIVFCGAPGCDPGFRVEQFAQEFGQAIESVSLGSNEILKTAFEAVSVALRCGKWVILKNAHLASAEWLETLLKKLQNAGHHAQFRLFVTVEASCGRSMSHLRNLTLAGRLVFVESAKSFKMVLESAVSLVSRAQANSGVKEKARIYFAVCWILAVLKRRVQYCPTGWAQSDIDWTERDQGLLLATIDELLTRCALNRINLAPEKIPWLAIRVLAKRAILGAKIDNDADYKTFCSIIDTLLNPNCFAANFNLLDDTCTFNESFVSPRTVTWDSFMQLIEEIPADEQPQWIGLNKDEATNQSIYLSETIMKDLVKIVSK